MKMQNFAAQLSQQGPSAVQTGHGSTMMQGMAAPGAMFERMQQMQRAALSASQKLPGGASASLLPASMQPAAPFSSQRQGGEHNGAALSSAAAVPRAGEAEQGGGEYQGGFSYSHSERDVPVHHLPEDVQQRLLQQQQQQASSSAPDEGGPSAVAGAPRKLEPVARGASYYEEVAPSSWRPSDSEDAGDDFLGLYRR